MEKFWPETTNYGSVNLLHRHRGTRLSHLVHEGHQDRSQAVAHNRRDLEKWRM